MEAQCPGVRIGRCGESTDRSDLDLLVDMSEGRSLLDMLALGDDLEEALGVVVDVVTEKSLSVSAGSDPGRGGLALKTELHPQQFAVFGVYSRMSPICGGRQ